MHPHLPACSIMFSAFAGSRYCMGKEVVLTLYHPPCRQAVVQVRMKDQAETSPDEPCLLCTLTDGQTTKY